MKLFFSQDDIRTLRDSNLLQVAAFLGLELKKKGPNYELYCPNPEHHDTHMGSCRINPKKNRGHCFACGRSFNAVDLLIWNGYAFYQSLELLAQLNGTTHLYTQNKEWYKIEERKNIPRLTVAEQDFIGFHTRHMIPSTHGMIGTEKVLLESEGWKDQTPDGSCFIKEVSNPATQLMYNDTKMYQWIVQNKCLETMLKYLTLEEELLNPYSTYRSSVTFDFLQDESVSLSDFRMAVRRKYKEAEAIYYRFGGEPLKASNVKEYIENIFQEFSNTREEQSA
jgi:hypothetical protein